MYKTDICGLFLGLLYTVCECVHRILVMRYEMLKCYK